MIFRLFGNVHLEADGHPLILHSRRAMALLAYLAVHHDQSVSRTVLAGVFWPESSESQAHTNLRKVIYLLRHELPEIAQALVVDESGALLSSAAVRLDLAAFETALARSTCARKAGDPVTEQYALELAVCAVAGELLPGFFDDWVLEAREQYRQALVSALQRLSRLLVLRRWYRDALRVLGQLQQLDPLIEETYRQQMRLLAWMGERASALRLFATCRNIFQHELGVYPDPMTIRLYEELLKQQGWDRPVAVAGVTADVRRVGRQAEWRLLEEAWKETEFGSARLVLVAGDSGIGKTRILEELLAWARQENITAIGAACYEGEHRLAFAPLVTWLRARPVPALPAVWLTELARLLPELSAARPDLPPPVLLQEGWQRTRFFEALVRALLHDRNELLLVLDDLHWCDSETLEWLGYLLRPPALPLTGAIAGQAAVRLLLVSGLRPDECGPDDRVARFLETLRRSGQLVEIHLAGLDKNETAQLCARAGRGQVSREQAGMIYRETEGNPLYVLELLRSGLAPNPSGQVLPPAMRSVIASRLARLSAPTRELAGLAAVAGMKVSLELLYAASRFDELTFTQSIEELLVRRILREMGPDDVLFTHEKIRAVAESELSAVRRHLFQRRLQDAAASLPGLPARWRSPG